MKKLMALLLACAMVLSMAACGSSDASSAAASAAASEAASASTEEAAPAEEEAAPAEEEAAPAEEEAATTPEMIEASAMEEVTADEVDLTGKKAAIIVPMLTVEALQVICDNFVKDCAEYGIEADSASADVDIPRYISLIENYVADHYDILVIIPIDATGLEDAVAEARAAGTKVVMLSTVPTYEVDGGLVCDYQACGKAVGDMAVAWMEQTFTDAATDSIGYAVVASENPEEYKQCKEAMIETIDASDAGYVAYVSGEEVGGSVDAGYSFAQEALTADPNIHIFVCNEPDSAKGIDNYLMAQGLDLTQYAVFAINTDETAAERVQQSTTGESVLRGLIPYGSDDTGLVASQIVVSILSESVETPYWAHDEIFTNNSFGWEYVAE